MLPLLGRLSAEGFERALTEHSAVDDNLPAGVFGAVSVCPRDGALLKALGQQPRPLGGVETGAENLTNLNLADRPVNLDFKLWVYSSSV